MSLSTRRGWRHPQPQGVITCLVMALLTVVSLCQGGLAHDSPEGWAACQHNSSWLLAHGPSVSPVTALVWFSPTSRCLLSQEYTLLVFKPPRLFRL